MVNRVGMGQETGRATVKGKEETGPATVKGKGPDTVKRMERGLGIVSCNT
jgi:hypothetical protein